MQYANSMLVFISICRMGLMKMKYVAVSLVGVLSACANLRHSSQEKKSTNSWRGNCSTRISLLQTHFLDLYTKGGRKIFDGLNTEMQPYGTPWSWDFSFFESHA